MISWIKHCTMFRAAIALVAGEAVAFALPEFSSAWPLSLTAMLFGAAVAYGWNWRHCVLPLVFLLGVTLAQRADSRLSAVEASSSTQTVNLEVLRVDPPKGANSDKASFLSNIGGIPVRAVISVPKGTSPRIGDVWTCTGRLAPPRPGASRFAVRKFWAHHPGNAVLNQAGGSSAAERYRRAGDWLAERAAVGLKGHPEIAGLNQAMLLGRRSAIPRDLKDAFVSAGTVHVFAISGLHVMIVGNIIGILLGLTGMGKRSIALLAIPLATAFVLLTGARPSAVRALIMMSIASAAPIFNRESDHLAAWSVTAFAIYAYDPTKLFDPGCALSFTVMFGVVIWMHWRSTYPISLRSLERLAESLRRGDHPYLSLAIRKTRGMAIKLVANISASTATWLAGTPIAASLFGRITPGALLANVFIINLAGITICTGFIGTLLACIWEPLGAPLNFVSGCSTTLMVKISQLVASIPYSSIEVEPWGPAQCIAWYAATFAIMTAADRWMVRRNKGLAWLGK